MTPEEMAAIDQKIAVLERQTDLLVEIEGIRRDMRSFDELTPEEYKAYVEAIDLWNDGSDPPSRMIDALERFSKEFGVKFPWQEGYEADQVEDTEEDEGQ
jgi:hypothetical protein